MKLSLLHLNIWEGTFIDRIIEFVGQNDFDILQFQEVNGGEAARGGVYFNPHNAATASKDALVSGSKGIDSFTILQKNLSRYATHQLITWHKKEDKSSYAGLATFTKPSLVVLRKEIIRHNPVREIEDIWHRQVEDDPRASLALLLQINDAKFWIINTHLTWGPKPEDADFKMTQAKKLYEFVENLQEPFILAGDFNMMPDTRVVKMFETLSQNLTTKNHVTNTLNPRIHKAKHLFPPGFAVDYIFTHPRIRVTNFSVLDLDLSDHFGLIVGIDL